MQAFKAGSALNDAKSALGLKRKNKLSPVFRWVGLGVAALLLVLSIIAFFAPRVACASSGPTTLPGAPTALPCTEPLIWGGIYGLIATLVVLVIQSEVGFVKRALGFLLEVFWWRALIYVTMAIPCFFHTALIAGGVALVVLAVLYGAAACKGERDYLDKASVAQQEEKAKSSTMKSPV